MKKSIIRITAFIILLGLMLTGLNKIYSFKYSDGIAQHQVFDEQKKNTVDMLILGSSHAFVNFNNGTLYDEYGITSFNYGASAQYIWNTYFDLKEALKTQKPELIVLDAYGLTFDEEYTEEAKLIKSAYGMKWSKNKYDNIVESFGGENVKTLLWDYGRYHSRYRDLNKGDFIDPYGSLDIYYNWYNDDWKGQYLFYWTNPVEIKDYNDYDKEELLAPRAEEYYRKILKLAKDENIPIAVVVVPYELNHYEMGKYLTAEEISKEYDADFLNANLILDEIGLDETEHFYDPAHMNAKGSAVFSSYMGKYYKEKYNLSDRRNDPKYDSFKRNADYTRQFIKDGEIFTAENMKSVASLLNDSAYMVAVATEGECVTDEDTVGFILGEIGIDSPMSKGIWLVDGGKLMWSSQDGDEKYLMEGGHDFLLTYNSQDEVGDIYFDNNLANHKVANGVSFLIYDKETGIINCMAINSDYEFQIIQ